MFAKIIGHCVLLLMLFSLIEGQSKFHAITTNSAAAEGYFYKGISELQTGSRIKAAALFEAAVQLDSSFTLAYIFRWKTGVSGFNTSEVYFQHGIKKINSISDYERGLVKILTNERNRENIENEIVRLNANYGYNVQFLYCLGNYYLESDNLNEALNYYEKCSQAEPNNIFWYVVYGEALMLSGNLEYAGKLINKYAAKLPESPIGHGLLGELYFRKAEIDKSVEQYNLALTKNKTYLPAYRGLGRTYTFTGNYEKAKECYQSMFDNSSDITEKLEALKLLADCDVFKGDIKQALRISEISEKLAQKYRLTKELADCYNHKGYMKIHAGLYDSGMQEFERADRTIELSSLPEELKNKYEIIASINRCYALITRGMIKEAENEAFLSKNMLEKNNNPKLLRILNTKLALLAFRKGEDKKAVKLLSKSKLDYYNLTQIGIYYNSTGNQDRAKYFYNLADEKRSFTSTLSEYHSLN